MQDLAVILASPAFTVAVAAALAWPALTGFPTWSALARGRPSSTLAGSIGVGALTYAVLDRFAAAWSG